MPLVSQRTTFSLRMPIDLISSMHAIPAEPAPLQTSFAVFMALRFLEGAAHILALSSLSRSRWFVAILYAGLAFFTHAVFGVIGAAVEGSAFSWVSIFANVRQVGDVLFLMPPRHDTHPLVSAAVIAIIVAASALVLRRRIRAIEVVT